MSRVNNAIHEVVLTSLVNFALVASAGYAMSADSEKPLTSAEVKERLDKRRVDLKCHEVPLTDFIDGLSKRHGFPIQIDTDAIDDNWHNDRPVTCDLKNVTLRQGLKSVLKRFQLNFVVFGERGEPGVVFIVNKKKSDEIMLEKRNEGQLPERTVENGHHESDCLGIESSETREPQNSAAATRGFRLGETNP
jgi:hypothetical protein